MTIRAAFFMAFQLAASFVTAAYIVLHTVPYVPLAPLPWWQSIVTWPWMMIYRLNPDLTIWPTMGILCTLYSATLFVVFRYAIMKPLQRHFSN
jgi:hypothetical protein